jgi:hypothetical protein
VDIQSGRLSVAIQEEAKLSVDVIDFVAARKMYQKIYEEAALTVDELFNCSIFMFDGIQPCGDLHRASAIYWTQLAEDGSGEVEDETCVTQVQFWNNLMKSGFKIDFYNFDAVDACNFMQVGVFGEIVYG